VRACSAPASAQQDCTIFAWRSDQKVGALFRPRASSTAIVQGRAAFDAAQTELRELTLRAGTFTEHERQVKAVDGERKRLVADIGEARTTQNAQERLRTVMPLLATRERVLEELESLAAAPELPADARERRLVAAERETSDTQSAEAAHARVEELERRIDEIKLDTTLLERELAIKELHGRLANVREGGGDLGRQKIKLEAATLLAQEALDQVRPDLDLESAAQLRLTETQRARVERALEHRAQLTALSQATARSAEDAEDRVDEIADELDGLNPPTDTAALAAAVTAARADGQIEARLVDAEGALAGAIDQLNAELRRLDPGADVVTLCAIRPPSTAAVKQFADARDELDARSRDLADARTRLDKDFRDLDEDVSRLALSTDAPTIEDLGFAREQRDHEWQELRRSLEHPVVTSASPDTFEGHVRRADAVADRLRIEADNVARQAELTVRKRCFDAEARDLDGREQSLETDRAAHDGRWASAWEAAGIAASSPHEMADWLRCRERVLERADAATRGERVVDAEQRARDGHAESLRAILAELGHESSTIASLSGLLAMAQTQVSKAQTAREDHEQLTRDLVIARGTAAKNRTKAEEHRNALQRWLDAWTSIAAANCWPDDIGADSARQVLATVTELADRVQEIAQLTTRVDGIQDRLNTFDEDAAALIGAIAPELDSWPLHDAVAELERMVSKAVQARSSRDTLVGELDGAREELAGANRSVDDAARQLETLVALAGVATIDELPEAERRSSRAADLHGQLPELEHQITDAGHASLRDLIERAEDVDIDALDAQSAESDDEITCLEEQLHDLDVRIGELRGEQRKMECLQGAACAAEQVEQRAAQLRELAERYVRLDLAAWALSEAIDAYRQAHKAPVLQRASKLFPQLTCGAFQGLEVSFDEADDPVIVGVRRTGEKVPVKLMSTGTREQLYLALRLASLERHVDLRGPMPVILDDVVLHSDPQRKTAILRALADLGERTQVITFTHDPQVVALAQHAIDPDRLTVHELGGSEITGAVQPAILAGNVRAVLPARAA
jgi:hypothetical protein